jgi:rhodanese-related sulfurtransferase
MTSVSTTASVSTAEIRASLINRAEIALLDVRDEASFAEAHPLFAASLPLDRLDLEVFDRIPRRTTPIVVYDHGEELVRSAVARLHELGYTNVCTLDGGLDGWRRAGGELFRDVNVPSKAFGELVEARQHTPSLSAEELKDLLDAHADVVVLDARRFDEYLTMSIPTGISVPGGELVYRVGELAPRPETLVVVNCAGRTRSIIGAQSLVNARIPNRVAALRNGTIGWTLAGLTLDRGQSRRFLPVDDRSLQRARTAARRVAARAGVVWVDLQRVAEWAGDDTRTTYRFDVRTPEEFAGRHLSHFRSAPGGQLVQETDVFAPVRGARIVLADQDGVRADMTGSWLAQMGWDVAVLGALDAGIDAEMVVGEPPVVLPPRLKRYKRPYEGTDSARSAIQAYLDWESGLVASSTATEHTDFACVPTSRTVARRPCLCSTVPGKGEGIRVRGHGRREWSSWSMPEVKLP